MHQQRDRRAGARRWRTAVLLACFAGAGLTGCSGATDSDATNVAVCRAVPQQLDTLMRQLATRPQDPAAIRASLDSLTRTLEVRDTDASDPMRGDALVVQLNLGTTRQDLDRGAPVDTGHLAYVFDTFWTRECAAG